jgi:hypothetical protein
MLFTIRANAAQPSAPAQAPPQKQIALRLACFGGNWLKYYQKRKPRQGCAHGALPEQRN